MYSTHLPFSCNCVRPKYKEQLTNGSASIKKTHQVWWQMPLLPALERQRQADLCEFGASLVYVVNSEQLE